MISKDEITHNINSEWEITLKYQKESRYTLCKFIIEVCQKINLPDETASLAMLLTNFFFIRKCYFNYDKLTVSCAAILLASKTQTSLCKFNEISKEYSNIQSKIIGPEAVQKIKEQIGKYELFLLKELNFNIPEDFPHDLIYVYADLICLDQEQDIINKAIAMANDSYFTLANNIYKPYVVALACLVLAAKFLKLPTILDENYKYINNMKKIHKKNMTEEEFNKILIQYNEQKYIKLDENKQCDKLEDEKYFESLPLCQKLHPNLKMDDLLDCIKLIIEFYQDMKESNNLNINKITG